MTEVTKGVVSANHEIFTLLVFVPCLWFKGVIDKYSPWKLCGWVLVLLCRPFS